MRLPTAVRGSSIVAVSSVFFAVAVAFASPKSRIFACPLLVTKMFAGLMSR